MKVKCVAGRPLGENVYIYYDEISKEGVLVDPGNGAGKIALWARDEGIMVKAVLLTHGHFDHIEGLDDVLAVFAGVPICAMGEEAEMLADAYLNGTDTHTAEPILVTPDKLFCDGDVFAFGSHRIDVLHTPGHTVGCCCFYDADAGVLFTGDTLFLHSIGRTDFVNSAPDAIAPSIRGKLYVLPEGTKVYPGHGARTTIGEEKRENPFVRGAEYDV